MADGGGLASVLAGAQIAAEKATDDAAALTLARSTAFHALSLILRALQAAMESDAMEREPRGPSWTEAVRAALEDAITSKALAATVGWRLIDFVVGWDGSRLRGGGWLAAGGGWSSGHADTTRSRLVSDSGANMAVQVPGRVLCVSSRGSPSLRHDEVVSAAGGA